jgi:transposase
VPHGNWKTTTFIAALRHDRVTAPFVLEGAMNGEMFKAYVEQILAPALRRGDIVFMDNVSVHKVVGVREAIEARGAILVYLPAYSPDLNPIEQVFAKLKAILRKIAAYTLKNAAYSIKVFARPSHLALMRFLELNVLHTSQIQAMVNLNGKRSMSRNCTIAIAGFFLQPNRPGPVPPGADMVDRTCCLAS